MHHPIKIRAVEHTTELINRQRNIKADEVRILAILSSAWGHNTLALAILCFVKAWPCLHHRGAILRDPHKEPRLEDLGRGITSHLNALADKLPPSAATFPFRTLVLCRICIPDGSSLLASILSPTE